MANPLSEVIRLIRKSRYGRDMRKAIADGFRIIAEGSVGSTSSMDISREDYDKLKEEDKTDGTVYFITDEGLIARNGVIYGE